MDFTVKAFKDLVVALQVSGYKTITFEDYMKDPKAQEKFVILRHDVDLMAYNSLVFAKLQHDLGARATYYFRIVKESNKPDIIKAIRDLGHEIGYHYEDLSLCKGDEKKAIIQFESNLAHFRKFYPISTICMHGSPLSKYDNRAIWKNYDYKSYGIIGEPYFDVDYSQLLYLTDTGRKWNGDKEVIRDKVVSPFQFNFRSTFDLIEAVQKNQLPNKLMINTHPQRWNSNFFFWTRELVMQNLKNQIKKVI